MNGHEKMNIDHFKCISASGHKTLCLKDKNINNQAETKCCDLNSGRIKAKSFLLVRLLVFPN